MSLGYADAMVIMVDGEGSNVAGIDTCSISESSLGLLV